MAKLMSVTERLTQIKKMQAQASFSDNQEIIDLPEQYIQDWSAGVSLTAGQLVTHDGVKYLVLQDVATLDSQLPSDAGMLAMYKPYTDATLKGWIYGEYVEIGWQRMYNGVVYTTIQDAGANIYSPDLVPAVWQLNVMEEIAPEILE